MIHFFFETFEYPYSTYFQEGIVEFACESYTV